MRSYVIVSAAVFGIYAFFHLLRVVLGWPANVGGWAVPLWLSGLGALWNGGLAIWAFRLRSHGAPQA